MEVPVSDPYPQIRRSQIEIVFALGGGELHVPHDQFPDPWVGLIEFWYLGAPNYAEELKGAKRITCPACGGTGEHDHDDGDCAGCDGAGTVTMEMRTAIQDCLFGFPDPPEGWERIAAYRSTGEAECWACGAGGEGEPDPACQLCDGGGFVYLGDGWHEVVYRRQVR
jgi:hypothetical protein